MQLITPVFGHESLIPAKYTCDGQGVNPPLRISDVPERAVSLALLVDDPDVPRSIRPDGMWDHWVLFNIPASTTSIEEDSIPDGIQGSNTSGKQAYQPPCPPDREHRYFFKLYALDGMLDLPIGALKSDVEQAMQGHILAEAVLMGRYDKIRRV